MILQNKSTSVLERGEGGGDWRGEGGGRWGRERHAHASEIEDIDPSRKHGKDGEGERHLGEAELQLAGRRPASELVRADAVRPALMAVSMDAFPRSVVHCSVLVVRFVPQRQEGGAHRRG